jgi:hypothetical protein
MTGPLLAVSLVLLAADLFPTGHEKQTAAMAARP